MFVKKTKGWTKEQRYEYYLQEYYKGNTSAKWNDSTLIGKLIMLIKGEF